MLYHLRQWWRSLVCSYRGHLWENQDSVTLSASWHTCTRCLAGHWNDRGICYPECPK